MKKFILIFAPCVTLSMVVFAKRIVLDIPDEEIKIVENDVLDAEQWIREAWTGKVGNCKKRIIKSEIERSVKEQEAIPAGDDAIVQKVFKRSDYENRKKRDERQERERQERIAKELEAQKNSPREAGTPAPN